MQQVEDHWTNAVTKRDQYALELVLAPQFIGISATGDVTTRNQQIARLFVKGAEPDSLSQKVVSVRFVGDIAIVNGTYVMSWKDDKGPVLEKGIFSHVFEHVRTNWLCLNSQRTVVAEDSKRAALRTSPKPSAAMPRCPFISPWSTRDQTAPSLRLHRAPTSLLRNDAKSWVRTKVGCPIQARSWLEWDPRTSTGEGQPDIRNRPGRKSQTALPGSDSQPGRALTQ